MHKVYKNQPKVPFSSTKGFTINKGNFEVMRRTHNQGEENDAFR